MKLTAIQMVGLIDPSANISYEMDRITDKRQANEELL